MKRLDFSKGWTFYKESSQKRETVDLPHDAMQYEPRGAEMPSGGAGAYYAGGIYRYEKVLDCAAELLDKHVELVFEGVYKDAQVYLDGELLLSHTYGYTAFSVVLDGKLDPARENRICVRVNNEKMPNSRWYTGSGIYRPVSLYIAEKEHIFLHGIRIRTCSIQPPRIQVDVAHSGEDVEVQIWDGEQRLAVCEENGGEITLPTARLWEEDHPILYQCRVLLKQGEKVVDQAQETFGIRQITWDSKGLYINGKSVLLRGACVHHDNGILGARSYEATEERRVRKLKEAGYNAIRSAHNPASEAMIRACDKYGVYLMDELWDVWYKAKNAYDYSGCFEQHYKEDIQAMVDKDYNHPSVILYSIANEVSEPAQQKGVALARELVSILHRADDTRPVTGGMNLMIISRSAQGNDIYQEGGGRDDSQDKKASGMNSMMFNIMTSMIGSSMNKAANGNKADKATTPVLDTLDIAGYNYASGRYKNEGKLHPDRLIFGSETFPGDIVKNWKMMEAYPYLIGDFMWTGWDYLGEVGAGAWAYTEDAKGFEKPYPWLLAQSGALDILGDPTGELYLAQMAWKKLPGAAIAVRPVNHPGTRVIKSAWRSSNGLHSWSWAGCRGNRAVVEVYGNGTKAELFVNGKSLGKKRIKDGPAIFKTTYVPGELRACVYDAHGAVVGQDKLKSASDRLHIGLTPETPYGTVGQPVYIQCDICDVEGIVEQNADETITLSVEGGKLLAFGSAEPRTEESFVSGRYTTYYGRAQVIVLRDTAGSVKVTASSKTLGETTLTVEVKAQ